MGGGAGLQGLRMAQHSRQGEPWKPRQRHGTACPQLRVCTVLRAAGCACIAVARRNALVASDRTGPARRPAALHRAGVYFQRRLTALHHAGVYFQRDDGPDPAGPGGHELGASLGRLCMLTGLVVHNVIGQEVGAATPVPACHLPSRPPVACGLGLPSSLVLLAPPAAARSLRLCLSKAPPLQLPAAACRSSVLGAMRVCSAGSALP